MKIKLRKIVDGVESISKLLNAPLPIKKAYHLSKLVSKVQSEMKQYGEVNNLTVKKYGKESEGSYSIPKTDTVNFEKYIKDMEELKEQDVELSNYQPIELTEEDLGELKLSAVDISVIEPFIIINEVEAGKKKESKSKK